MTALVPSARVAVLSLAFSVVALSLPAFARGNDENPDDPRSADWSVLAPHAAYPGDCAVVLVEYERGNDVPSRPTATLVELVDGAGTTRARATAFALASPKGTTRRREAALLALPNALASGDYRLIVSRPDDAGRDIRSDTPCTVEAREFPGETVSLDAANTAIKRNLGPERMAQIEELNAILFRADEGAERFPGPFAPPLTSTRRTSRFAERRIYEYSDGTSERTTHYGVDFGVPRGTPVFAAGDGRVILAKSRISTGWTVVLEHFPGVYSLYYHLDSLSCAEGETVRTGTLIGKSGSTGLSTGPHLHWEFRVNGEAVSPDWFVGRSLF